MTPKNARAKASCQGKNQNGKPCGSRPQAGSDFCKRHADQRDWADAFLGALSDTHMVTTAAAAAGIKRTAAYARRQRDLQFAQAWDDIEDQSTETLEREAYRRAAEGVLRPVFQGGDEVGQIREFSDTLLIFLLKARRPERYRERYQVDHTGQVQIDLARAEMIADVFRQVIADLNLSDEMREAALQAAAKQLRRAAGQEDDKP